MYAYLVIIFYLICLITIFPYYPIFGDKLNLWFLHNKWNHSDWATFLAGVLGLAGAFVTLYGVLWQVTRSEKQKKREKIKSFLIGFLYNINRNLMDSDLKSALFNSYEVLTSQEYTYIESPIKYIYPLTENNLKFNFEVLCYFEFYEEILELYESIETFNSSYYFLLQHSSEKNSLIKKIKTDFEINNIDNCILEALDYDDAQLRADIKKMSDNIIHSTKKLYRTKECLIQELEYKNNNFQKEIDFLNKYILYEKNLIDIDVFSLIKKMKNLKIKVEKELEKYK